MAIFHGPKRILFDRRSTARRRIRFRSLLSILSPFSRHGMDRPHCRHPSRNKSPGPRWTEDSGVVDIVGKANDSFGFPPSNPRSLSGCTPSRESS